MNKLSKSSPGVGVVTKALQVSLCVSLLCRGHCRQGQLSCSNAVELLRKQQLYAHQTLCVRPW